MLGIIDYKSGNIAAIANILKQRRVPYFVSGKASELEKAERYLLPGVGAFDPTMETLAKSGLITMLNEAVLGQRKPILGICVGMQLLSEGSDEGQLPGLGWIKGRVRKIDTRGLNRRPLLPHMGWNDVRIAPKASLFAGIKPDRGFYFLHSYYFDVASADDIAADVDYGGHMVCAVERGNVFGAQFHPEKSHSNGVRFLQNFAGYA